MSTVPTLVVVVATEEPVGSTVKTADVSPFLNPLYEMVNAGLATQ